MDMLTMLDELRKRHHVTLCSHPEGDERVVLELRDCTFSFLRAVQKYVGTLDRCIERAFAGELGDEVPGDNS